MTAASSKLFPLRPWQGHPKFDYVQRLSIYITGNMVNSALCDFKFRIQGYTPEEQSGCYGIPIDSEKCSAEDYIQGFLAADDVTRSAGLEPSPLDFTVYGKTLVIIRLFRDYWQFQTAATGLQTDVKQEPELYWLYGGYIIGADKTLKKVKDGDPCAGIAFVADASGEATPEKGKKSKLHFLVRFLQTNESCKLILPVDIDPDVENKGDR